MEVLSKKSNKLHTYHSYWHPLPYISISEQKQTLPRALGCNINTYIKVIRGYWLFHTAYFIKKRQKVNFMTLLIISGFCFVLNPFLYLDLSYKRGLNLSAINWLNGGYDNQLRICLVAYFLIKSLSTNNKQVASHSSVTNQLMSWLQRTESCLKNYMR